MQQFIKVGHAAAAPGACSLDHVPSWASLTGILARCFAAASLSPFHKRRFTRLLLLLAEQDSQEALLKIRN